MREITYFVADDGKRFDDADECREYELKLMMGDIDDSLIILNSEFEPLSIDHYDECMFVIIRNERAIEPLEMYCREHGYYTPWDYDDIKAECGIYMYDADNETFFNLQKQLLYYNKMMAEVQFSLGNNFGFESIYC